MMLVLGSLYYTRENMSDLKERVVNAGKSTIEGFVIKRVIRYPYQNNMNFSSVILHISVPLAQKGRYA